jgi:hypothetical protein
LAISLTAPSPQSRARDETHTVLLQIPHDIPALPVIVTGRKGKGKAPIPKPIRS